MTVLQWDDRRNLENSLTDFLTTEIANQNLTVLDESGNPKPIQARVGFRKSDDWMLPVISNYIDNRVAPRLSIGSNKREKSYLMIIDIRALDIGSQLDLSTWVAETINNGWDFFEYDPNPASPNNPLKVKKGFVSIDFISDVPVRLGDNADAFEKFRQNISVECTIAPII